MKVRSGLKRVSAGVAAGAFTAMFAAEAMAEELLGQPTPGGIGLQEAASPLKHDAHFFHDAILMPIITVISLFVMFLQIGEVTSTMLSEADAEARGVPYRLGATEPMIVPVNQVIRVQATGADVIHAFALPAFGLKIDAIPGRLNEQWFKAERVGTYYGQCSELCGIDHAFMPIEIRVVSQPEFDAWVATKAPPPAVTPVAAPGAVAADADGRPAPASANPAPTQVAPVDPAPAGPKNVSSAA